MREGRVLVITSHVAGSSSPLIATPTTTVQKKLHGRAMSDDFRIISNWRFPNLFCEKTGYPEGKMADMRLIAEKAVEMKTKWPHLPILRNKRDIDAVFKRVKVHHDMGIILCAEFAAEKLGLGDGNAMVIFLYLTLPFGWSASPSYFSQVGEGITVAHQEYAPHDKSRDGADLFRSHLFVDDAFFIEPDIGKRKELAIS